MPYRAITIITLLTLTACNTMSEHVTKCDFKIIGYQKSGKYGNAIFLVDNRVIKIRMGKHEIPSVTYGSVYEGICGKETRKDNSVKYSYSVSFPVGTKVGSSAFILPQYRELLSD